MQIITQPALIPGVYPKWWIDVGTDAWEWEWTENVTRRTENAAFERIAKEVAFKSLGRYMLLTDMHHHIRQMEIHLLRSKPHYKEPEVHEAIALQMRMTVGKVRKTLEYVENVYRVYALLGQEHLLVN